MKGKREPQLWTSEQQGSKGKGEEQSSLNTQQLQNIIQIIEDSWEQNSRPQESGPKKGKPQQDARWTGMKI